MDKERILEMSRQENINSDLISKNAELKVSLIAGVSMAVMSLVFYAAQVAFQGTLNWGFFAIITLYNAVLNLIRGIKLSKKRSNCCRHHLVVVDNPSFCYAYLHFD